MHLGTFDIFATKIFYYFNLTCLFVIYLLRLIPRFPHAVRELPSDF